MEASVAYSRHRVEWYHHMVDFANIFKAFVGTQYMTLSYGFSQSGILLGIIGLFVVAAMTTHCCTLIVKCKYYTIDYVCDILRAENVTLRQLDPNKIESSTAYIEATRKKLEKKMTYKDIGTVLYGRTGAIIVGVCLTITQAGFCVAYHIFNGNLLLTIIESNSGQEQSTSMIPLTNSSTLLQEATATPSSESWDWDSQVALIVLVLLPVPLFMLFTLFRRVRGIGPVSFLANIIVAIGFIITFTYILVDFKVGPGVELAKWSTFPVLLGQAAAAYEAIGTILTIESSMEGNRPRFPSFLVFSVLLFTSLFTPLAILGYIHYGDNTAQILLQNLPQQDIMVVITEFAVMTGVLLTYPLQIFPVIEILEGLLFGDGQPCGPGPDDPPCSGESVFSSRTPLLSDTVSCCEGSVDLNDPMEQLGYKVAITISNRVPTWKRNMLRLSIALVIAAVAVMLRNALAYASALVGAVGSTPIAFILPCLFHIKLRRHEMSWPVFIKDIFIITVATIFAFIIIIVTLKEIVLL